MINSLSTTRSRFIFCVALALMLVAASVLLFKHQIKGGAQAEPSAPAAVEPPRNDLSAAEPPVAAKIIVSTSADDQALGRKIDRAIETSGLQSARWGIFIMSVRDGRVLYERDADHTFIPASNMKIYTTAAALDLLGKDYRWRTSVYASRAPDVSGTVDGDLILYGRGAPDFTLRADRDGGGTLTALADDLFQRGVRRVRGRVVGDETFFRGEPLGDGWLWNDAQWYFGAEASALTIGGNEITVTVTPAGRAGEPAAIKLRPETDYVQIVNETRTVERDKLATIGINRGLSDNVIRVWGDFPSGRRGFNARLSVHRPALWAARRFRDELKARGIIVDGEAVLKQASGLKANGNSQPESGVELAYVTSSPLSEIVRSINKESLNLEAELVLRTLGKEKGATAPDPDQRKMLTRGHDKAGLAVIRQWLIKSGVATQYLALHDGSGLSRLNLVTPEATGRILAAMTKTPSAMVFRDSLPIAGRDGTLGSRLRKAGGRVLAKTGLLTYTNALSGYATTPDGELLVFSIICNNETAPQSSIHIIDTIAELLANPQLEE